MDKSASIATALATGNATLKDNLGNRGLVVIRDSIDIDDNPYVDCEIALLVDTSPGTAGNFFNLGTQYQTFYEARIGQSVIADTFYQKDDPSPAGAGTGLEAELQLPDDWTLSQLISTNSIQLAKITRRIRKTISTIWIALSSQRNRRAPRCLGKRCEEERGNTSAPVLSTPQPHGPLSISTQRK